MNQEKVSKKRPGWKVLRQWVIVTPLLALLCIAVIFLIQDHRVDKRTEIVGKAVNAGYKMIENSNFKIIGSKTVDGVEYDAFESPVSLLRSSSNAIVLIRKGAKYIDGVNGNLGLVEIYGKEVQWIDEKYVIVEPYAMVRPTSTASWDSVWILLLVVPVFALVELVLLVTCFGSYWKWKVQEANTQNEPDEDRKE